MAKSLRSKRMRKNRRVLREKYGKRELEMLKKTLANSTIDSSLVTMVSADKVKQKGSKTPSDDSDTPSDTEADTAEHIDMETNKTKVYNPKTLRNQHGSYPPWMSQARINKKTKNRKKHKKLKSLKNAQKSRK